MGNWNINIQGIGTHDNGTPEENPTDANVMAQKFVDELVVAGHTVEHAEITTGSKTSLLK